MNCGERMNVAVIAPRDEPTASKALELNRNSNRKKHPVRHAER